MQKIWYLEKKRILEHYRHTGEMAERSKAPPWKGGIGET